MVIYNKLIPFPGYKAINLFGLIFTKDKLTEVEINHENIHTAQMKELGYLGFYILYILDYILISLKYPSLSQKERYRKIKFEEEAYNNLNNLNYLKTRKKYGKHTC